MGLDYLPNGRAGIWKGSAKRELKGSRGGAEKGAEEKALLGSNSSEPQSRDEGIIHPHWVRVKPPIRPVPSLFPLLTA